MYQIYKDDLKLLIEKGEKILKSFRNLYCKEEFPDDEILDFTQNYQSWYSESKEVIAKILPNRLDDFIKQYEVPKGRKVIRKDNYTIEDALLKVKDNGMTGHYYVPKDAYLRLEQQFLILKSTLDVFDSALYNMQTLLQADMYDSELLSAKDLNKKGFIRAAGAIAGVVLEGHLLSVCQKYKYTIRKNPGINDLNELLKNDSKITTDVFRRIQYCGDIRNLCDHKKTEEPTREKVDELISGVDYIIKNVF